MISEDELDRMADDGRIVELARRLAAQAGDEWSTLDEGDQDDWCERAIGHLREINRIGPEAMKLTSQQEALLVELAEPNDNPENEWRLGGRGQNQTATSLVRKGLAKRHEMFRGASGGIFSLTPAGKALAAEIIKAAS